MGGFLMANSIRLLVWEDSVLQLGFVRCDDDVTAEDVIEIDAAELVEYEAAAAVVRRIERTIADRWHKARERRRKIE